MRAIALVSIGLSTIASAQVRDASDMSRKSIEIQPEELRAALATFGEVEDLHMVFLPDDVRNQNTSGVSGSLTYAEALGQLLRGTDLTYRFLEPHTVMILPASLAQAGPVEPSSASGSGDNKGEGIGGPAGPGFRMAQVTLTATKPSEAQQLEYFRLLAAMPRPDYEHRAQTLPFVDRVTIRFPGIGATRWEPHLRLGTRKQSATVDGIVLSRVFNLTKTKAESQMQAYNSNSFPVFVEIDYQRTRLGEGAYAALAPGETAVWTWPNSICVPYLPEPRLAPEGCVGYSIQPGVAHVRTLKDWDPG